MCICEPKRKLKRNYSAMENSESATIAHTEEMEDSGETAAAAAGSSMEVAPSSISVPSYYSKDVTDPYATPGQCGLYNLGNTCFMNAGLQSLLSTTPLLKFFLEQFTLEDCSQDTLITNFHQLVCKIWSGRYTIVYPRDFKNALALFHVQFQDYRQHDCQEFLALFLDTLHQQLKSKEDAAQNNLQSVSASAEKDQLNNSVSAKSVSDDESMVTQDASSGSFPVPLYEDSANVSYVIQSELPSLLRSVVRTDSSGDLEKSQSDTCMNELEPILNNASNLKQRIPKIEEFYAKDTKTLNTNVLSEDFEKEDLATDSEKFPKQELNNHADNELVMPAPVEAVAISPNKEEAARKGPKNTNIQAEKINKMQKTCEMDAEGDGIIKKMKFECTEKNFQYKALSKINKDFEINEQNLKLASFGMEGVNLIKDLGILGSLDKDMCDNVMRRTQLLVEDKCPPYAAPDGDHLRTAEDKKQKNSEDRVQSMDLQVSKNVKTKKSQLSENSYKKIKCEVKHEGSPADSILSTDNEEDKEEGGNQNSEATEVDLLERDEEVQVDPEEEAAEKAWENYIRDNHSIIVSTFQGQFKSTVVCSECNHVSVTFEPFMYLSVPLPHASDRQLCVIFVPLEGSPMRYLITLQKSDKINKVKEELKTLIGQSYDSDVVLQEDSVMIQYVEDSVMIQYINDSSRVVYAYEMPPCPVITTEVQELPQCPDFSSLQNESKEYSVSQTATEGDIFSSMGTFSKRDVSDINKYMQSSDTTGKFKDAPETESHPRGSESWGATGGDLESATALGEWTDSKMSDNWGSGQGASKWTQSDSDDLRKSLNEVMVDVPGAGMWNQNFSAGHSSPVHNTSWLDGSCEVDGRVDTASGWDLTNTLPVDDTLMKSDPLPESVTWDSGAHLSGSGWDSSAIPAAQATVVADKWKSCAICLEELEDSELLSHTGCGGTFCQICLEMSIKHYGEESYVCPVCSTAAVLTKDFCPLDGGSSSTQNLRLLAVPVSLRDEVGSCAKLVGHPRLVYLYNTMSGAQLYECILNLFPVLAQCTIVLTDGQGLRCSRCQYSDQCQGCPISRDSQIHLRPGDCLSVCLSGLSQTCINDLEGSVDHQTMENLRPEKSLSIYDCLQAFTDSEDLDEHNPWYCPRCQRNQCAKKTITVWQYPDTLILHLKRFVYHDLSSNKVDAEVIFPLEDLNLSQYTSGPDSGSLTYDLYSIVCHFGGANAGHYTTFAKHPLNGQWFYYNDESVSHQVPKKEDYKNAYILFYNRQGTDVKFDLPKIPMDQSSLLRETPNNRSRAAAIPLNSGQQLVYGPLNIDQISDDLKNQTDYDELDNGSPEEKKMVE
ncbi:uncharacterized protein LOC134246383 [Saccostrea cucullata]|uniref:uncharacterized protein LOC134246383 n=1 Tax=Saccostrea cuccullata TaxID=36930 RepID=UPI002ED3E6C7